MNKKNIIIASLLFLTAILSFFSNEPFNKNILQLNFFNTFIFSFFVLLNNKLLLPKGVVKFKNQLKEFTGLLKWKNKYIKFFVFLTPACLSFPFLLKKNLTEFTIVFALLFLQNIITFLVLSRFNLNKNKTIIFNFLMLFLVLFIIANRYNIFILKFIVYLTGASTTFYYLISDTTVSINWSIIYGFSITSMAIFLMYFFYVIINYFKKHHKKY